MGSIEEDLRKIMNKDPFADPFIETFDAATDSLEAISDAIAAIEAGIFAYGLVSGPHEVEINDKADFELELLNPGGAIVPAGSITPGTYTIYRIRDGTKTSIYTHASVAAAGKIVLDTPYQFTSANWAVGDLFQIVFSGASTNIGGTVTNFPDMLLTGRIVRDEVISDKIGTPPANLVDIVTMLGNPNTAGRTLYGDLGDFIGQTNLKSLLAVLGSGWDAANKDIYTALITDRLDQANYGLAALHGDIGDKGAGVDIITRLGAWDGGADPQGDIFQALGVPVTNSVWSAIQYIHHAAVSSPAAGSLAQVLAESIYGRTNLKTLNALLDIPDDANGSLGDRLGFSAGSPFTVTENLKDILGNLSTTKNLGGILGAFTVAENLKAILGDLSTTKRLGQILGAFDETDTLKATLGAFTATENLKAILGDLSTTKRLGQILGALDETDTLKAILGAFTATENLKGILGDLSITKNLGGILGAFTTAENLKAIFGDLSTTKRLGQILGALDETNTLKAILGTFTAAENLKAILGDLSTTKNLGGILGAFDTTDNLKAILGDLSATKNLGGILGAFTTVNNLRALLGTGFTPTVNLYDLLGGYTNAAGNTLKSHVDTLRNAAIGPTAQPGVLSRSISDYVRGIGVNTASDGFDSAAVTPNPDGSIFERLEDLKTGIFFEQADVAVNITAIAGSETNVFDLSVANTRYIVRHLRLKFADPSTETVTVRLYELINDVLTVVDTFIVDNTNFGTYFSLMDMFGVPHLAGDNLKVTVRASGGAGVAVTGQYSHAKTNV